MQNRLPGKVVQQLQDKQGHLHVLEQDVGSERAVWCRLGHFCCRDVHALEVVPCCAVGLDCLSHCIQEVSHVYTAKGVPASDGHPEKVNLHAEISRIRKNACLCSLREGNDVALLQSM